MFTLIILIVSVILVLGVLFQNRKNNIFGAIWNRVRTVSRKGAENINNPIDNAVLAIEDSHTQINEFERSLAHAIALQNRLKSRLKETDKDIQKYSSIADLAVQAGSDEDARTALNQKIELESKAKTLTQEINQNKKHIEDQKVQLNRAKSKVEAAESNKDILAVRLEGAKVRKSMTESGSLLNSTGGLAALKSLEEEVENLESEAEAIEELDGAGKPTLEEKYTGSNVTVEQQLAELKARRVQA